MNQQAQRDINRKLRVLNHEKSQKMYQRHSGILAFPEKLFISGRETTYNMVNKHL